MLFRRFERYFLRGGDFAWHPEGGEVLGGDVAFLPALVAVAAVGEISQLGFVEFEFALDALVASSFEVLLDGDLAVFAPYDFLSQAA